MVLISCSWKDGKAIIVLRLVALTRYGETAGAYLKPSPLLTSVHDTRHSASRQGRKVSIHSSTKSPFYNGDCQHNSRVQWSQKRCGSSQPRPDRFESPTHEMQPKPNAVWVAKNLDRTWTSRKPNTIAVPICQYLAQSSSKKFPSFPVRWELAQRPTTRQCVKTERPRNIQS